MNTQEVVSAVVAAFPVIVALSGALYQHLLERLPSRQREVVAQTAHIAVTVADQVGAALDGPSKKAIATDVLHSVLSTPMAGKLKLDPKVADAIIEATVNAAHGQPEPVSEPIGFSAPATLASSGESAASSPNLRQKR